MNDKVELVLNRLIKQYLIESEPLSSTKLKEVADLPFSASSIRGYLKKLEAQKLVEKQHFSSGSYPSVKAMREFWQKNLQECDIRDDALDKKAETLNIYIMIEMFDNQMLIDVYNLNDKFIVLEFEKEELIFKYDVNLYNFFKSLKGIYLNELKSYLQKIRLEEVYEKIKTLFVYLSFNKKFLCSVNMDIQALEEYDFDSFKDGISFFENYLFYKTDLIEENIYKRILITGDVYTNFFNIVQPKKGGE